MVYKKEAVKQWDEDLKVGFQFERWLHLLDEDGASRIDGTREWNCYLVIYTQCHDANHEVLP